MSARMLLLLVLVVWSRLWAGVPESVAHVSHDTALSHHEQLDHLAMLGHDANHSTGDWEHPGTSDASTATAGEHHHHLHACSAGGAALMVADLSIDLSAATAPIMVSVFHHSNRLPERLLRPPAA